MSADEGRAGKALDKGFIYRVVLVLGLLAVGALMVRLSGVLLLLFGAVVVAVVLRAIADPLNKRTPLNGPASLALTIVFLFALTVLCFWLFGREVSRQVGELVETLPGAVEDLSARLEESPLGLRITEGLDNAAGALTDFLSRAPMIAFNVVTGATTFVVVLITGMILAGKPGNYRDGIVVLFPPSVREGMREAFDAAGRGLRLWLLAQLFSMTVIGLMIGIGLSIVGLPSALALALFAALAQFVPLVGPIVASIPALIIAAAVDMQTFVWTLIVVVFVQQFEGNFLTPVVARRAAHIPIPITLFAVLAFGVLFGLPGVILAAPLAVVLYVMVKKLYLRDLLGDDVVLPGEKPPKARGA